MPDHIHLFVCMSTTVSISELMKHVKGGSSRLIHRELAPRAFFEWQGSYGVFSVRPADKDRVVVNIENQERHHRERSLWPEAEPDSQPGHLPFCSLAVKRAKESASASTFSIDHSGITA
jgi:hypothetical protein